jgi:hypothetical protein
MLLTCTSPTRLVVHRVENAKFDRAIKRIAKREHARVEIADAPVSYATWRKISRKVASRNAELRKAGARLADTDFASEGRMTIGVSGDLRAARRILRDLIKLGFVSVVASDPVEST